MSGFSHTWKLKTNCEIALKTLTPYRRVLSKKRKPTEKWGNCHNEAVLFVHLRLETPIDDMFFAHSSEIPPKPNKKKPLIASFGNPS